MKVTNKESKKCPWRPRWLSIYTFCKWLLRPKDDAFRILTTPVIIRWYKILNKPFTRAIDTLFIGIGLQQTNKHINIQNIHATHQDIVNIGPGYGTTSEKGWITFILVFFLLFFLSLAFLHSCIVSPFISSSLIECFCSKSSTRSSDLYRTHYFNNTSIVIKVECL